MRSLYGRSGFGLLTVLFVILGVLAPVPGTVAAQQVQSRFSVNAVELSCDASVVTASWTSNIAITGVTISISNTSSNWADQMTTTDANGVAWEFDHHKIDKIVIDAVLEDGSTWRQEFTITSCGVPVAPEETTSPPAILNAGDFTVTSVSWTCDGAASFSVETTQTGTMTVTSTRVSQWWEGTDGDPWRFTRTIAVDGSGTYSASFPPFNGITSAFTIEFGGVVVFDGRVECEPNPLNPTRISVFATGVTDRVCGHGQVIVSTPVPLRIVVQPLEDLVPLGPPQEFLVEPTGPDGVTIPFRFNAHDIADGLNLYANADVYDARTGERFTGSYSNPYQIMYCQSFAPLPGDISLSLLLPEGVSLVGAPFGVYAPAASTLPPGAYYTGIVGAGNTILLPDLLPGTYRIMIAPADADLISFDITLTDTTTSLVIDLTGDEEPTDPGVPPDPEPEPPTDPGETPAKPVAPGGNAAENASTGTVQKLPAAGSGSTSPGATPIPVSVFAIMVLVMLSASILRRPSIRSNGGR